MRFNLMFTTAIMIITINPVYSIELSTAFQDSSPKYIKTKNQYHGICVDILNALNSHFIKHNIDIKINTPKHFTPIKRIKKNLTENKTDLFCGISKNKERLKLYNYSENPLFTMRRIAVYKKGQTPVHSLDDIIKSGSMLTTLFDTSYHRNALKAGVNPNQIIHTASVDQSLSLLEKGRAQYFFYHDLGALYGVQNSQLKGNVKYSDIIKPYQQYMAISKHLDKETVQHLNNAINTAIDDGTLDYSIKYYTE